MLRRPRSFLLVGVSLICSLWGSSTDQVIVHAVTTNKVFLVAFSILASSPGVHARRKYTCICVASSMHGPSLDRADITFQLSHLLSGFWTRRSVGSRCVAGVQSAEAMDASDVRLVMAWALADRSSCNVAAIIVQYQGHTICMGPATSALQRLPYVRVFGTIKQVRSAERLQAQD